MRWVSVIGASECTPEEADLAESVGQGLAEAGIGIICGGGAGVMKAACRGAAGAGGLSIGLLPGEDPGSGNAFLTAPVPTGMGEGRNALVVRAGRAVIAIGGGLGTLSEIALALRMGKPVVALKTWTASSPDGQLLAVLPATTGAEAVAAAVREVA